MLLLFCLPFFTVSIYGIDGVSMETTIYDGDYVLVNKLKYVRNDLRYTNIIAIKLENGEKIVKRVVGMPGDTLKMENGVLYRNGNVVNEAYIEHYTDEQKSLLNFNEYHITSGYYFVMGDNRLNSVDSRNVSIGLIPKEDIIGRVITQYTLNPN